MDEMSKLRAGVRKRTKTRAADEAALTEVQDLIAAAIAANHPVSGVVEATGYTRETIRRITRERGVKVDGRANRYRPQAD